MYKTMAATESEESAAVLWNLIKVKTKEIMDAQQKMAAFHEVPRVKHYSPFTIEKCMHTLAVIEAAWKMVHDFMVDENVDPTMVQCLFQEKLITNTKTSSWDAWQSLMAIGRQSHGAHAAFLLKLRSMTFYI